MFTPKTRLIILAGCAILGSLAFYQDRPYALVVVVMVLLINIYGYIRQGTVYLSFKQLRKGEHKQAEETLKLTKKVNWLSKTQKGYYYFVSGYLNMAKGKVEEAKDEFTKATQIGLRLKNDQALAYANLATLYHRSKNKIQAREFLRKAEGLKVKHSTKKELERLNSMIA